MEKHILTSEQIAAYSRWLQEEERSAATLEKYLRDIRAFAAWMDGESVTKEAVTGWKEHLVAEQRAASTINAALSALNGLFQFLGWDIRAKFLKVQRRSFRDPARELSRNDYEVLITTARKRGQDRLALLMETICATGIRVSELRYWNLPVPKPYGGDTNIIRGKRSWIIADAANQRLRAMYWETIQSPMTFAFIRIIQESQAAPALTHPGNKWIGFGFLC